MSEIIVVTELGKNYGRVRALHGVSFCVERGEVYGIIGPNGAGKTTLLSILAGLRRPDKGECRVLGAVVKPGGNTIVHRLGFFSPNLAVLDYLRGREMLTVVGRLHGLSPLETGSRAEEMLRFFGMEGAGEQIIHEYSQGMRMKLGLACALIHGPEVWLLDEPFSGLDPTAVYRMVQLIERAVGRGKTILLSSHDLALVERVCSRVGILHQGELKEELSLRVDDRDPPSARPVPAGETARLESTLWGVVGTPEVPEISWL